MNTKVSLVVGAPISTIAVMVGVMDKDMAVGMEGTINRDNNQVGPEVV